MAAAEARTVWQRTANRYFVQEDAKRAPKLAYCSSSNTSSNDESPTAPDHSSSKTVPLNWNPTSPNIPPDTTWWLQLQPNYACPKDYMHEKLNTLDSKLESSKEGEKSPNSSINKDPLPSKNSLSDLRERAFTTCVKHEIDIGLTPLKASNNNFQRLPKNKDDICNSYKEKDMVDRKSLDPESVNKSEQKLVDVETSWLENEKAGPWWRTIDRTELASLVAQKSMEPIRNCDLPQPREMNNVQTMISCLESFEKDGFFPFVLDQKVDNELVSAFDHLQHELVHKKSSLDDLLAGEIKHPHYELDNLNRNKSCSSGAAKEPSENKLLPGSEPSKAQLLEALRHSQTRAREAEKAAQQAYTEKEHIVKLFFRQASQLFAYKQWIQLLQLESLILQLKSKEHQLSTLFPVLPWMPLKVKQLRKEERRSVKSKGASKCYDMCKYAVAFAVGLGLAGAGLLLGWTMGWLFPAF